MIHHPLYHLREIGGGGEIKNCMEDGAGQSSSLFRTWAPMGLSGLNPSLRNVAAQSNAAVYMSQCFLSQALPFCFSSPTFFSLRSPGYCTCRQCRLGSLRLTIVDTLMASFERERERDLHKISPLLKDPNSHMLLERISSDPLQIEFARQF